MSTILKMTKSQFDCTVRDFREYVKGESIEVEFKSQKFYVFGSELAVLRLYARYRGSKNTDYKFSENLNRWYFTLELSSFEGDFSTQSEVGGKNR